MRKQNLVNAFRTDPINGLPYLDGSFNDVNVTENYDGCIDPRVENSINLLLSYW